MPAVEVTVQTPEEDDMQDLFGSPEMSTSLALPPAPDVQESTADAPEASASESNPSLPDISYDEWYMELMAHADSAMDFSSLFAI
jgi:hypothetical protein